MTSRDIAADGTHRTIVESNPSDDQYNHQYKSDSTLAAGHHMWDRELFFEHVQNAKASREHRAGADSVSPKPVIARIVSRGKMGQVASDFGCLEVVGGASIGHTDPFRLRDMILETITKSEDVYIVG